MRRGLVWLLAVVVVAVALAAWWATRETPVPVVLQPVEPGRVEATVANTRAGTVEACKRARMAPPTAGQIERLPVREGDRVQADDLLLELWNDDLEAQLVLAEREMEAALSRAEEACALADVARSDAERLLRLRKQGVASEEATEQAVGARTAKGAGCQAARSSARVAAARVDVARAALERTRLRAPFAGIVAEVNGEVGEFVTPSPVGIPMPPTVDLIDTDCLYVKAPIDEVDAAGVRPGMEARVALDAFKGRTFKGKVRRVAPYVLDLEKQARTVDVEVDFADPAETRGLLAGYSADVELVLDSRDGVPRVPSEAVLEGNRVLAYRESDGRLEERRIEPGLANWQHTEVRAGLEPGARIVTSVGREGVAAGVRAAPEAPPDGGNAGR